MCLVTFVLVLVFTIDSKDRIKRRQRVYKEKKKYKNIFSVFCRIFKNIAVTGNLEISRHYFRGIIYFAVKHHLIPYLLCVRLVLYMLLWSLNEL